MFKTVIIRYQGEEIVAHTGMTLLQVLWESGHRLVEHIGCLGVEFKQKIEGIVEAFTSMQDQQIGRAHV